MKIIFIVRSMDMGGAGKQLALTAKALADGGHEVAVYTYMGNILAHTLDPRIQYIPEPQAPKSKLQEYLLTVPHIHRLLKQERPDIAISWRANAGCFTVLAAIRTKTRTVFSERTDPYMETNAILKVATRICNFSDGGVFQTVKARDYYKKLVSKSVVIPNIITMGQVSSEIIPMNERRKEIAWVGRFFNTQKRIDIALKAMKLIHQQCPDYTLGLYGDGNDRPQVEQWIKEMGLEKCVTLHGATKDIVHVINSSRMLMLSSDYEGIPNVVIEAFLAGTPVAATDCSPGGARFLIEDGKNGFVVPMRDAKLLSDRCVQIIKDDALSESFVKASREKLNTFAPEQVCEAWRQYIGTFDAH